jgi:fluoride exporter
MWQISVLVALGSMIGGTARWLASESLVDAFGTGFPFGTLFVNVTGSFLVGLYAAATLRGSRWTSGTRQREFVVTGICGGYTTFSIFSIESIQLFQAGRPGLAATYVTLSIVTWLIGAWAGFSALSRRTPR